jgi:tellurite resistance protein
VPPKAIAALVADLQDQLQEDGLDRRIEELSKHVARPDHAREVLRIAALIAQVSDNVSDVERAVLVKIASGTGMAITDVEAAINDVRAALSAG